MHLRSLPFLAAALSLALVAPPLQAAAKIDLDRIAPVPADQPIPTQDFFRLPQLSSPTLNPAGTHLAGLIADGDRTLLIVSDLEKHTSEVAGVPQEYFAMTPIWLNDTRVTAYFGFRKSYGMSLGAADVGHINSPYPLLQFAMRSQFRRRTAAPTRPLVWIGANLDSSSNDVGVAEVNTDVSGGSFVNLMNAGGGSDYVETREANWKHIDKVLPKLPDPLVTDYIADKNGELEFGISSQDGVFSLHRFASGKWTKTAVDLDAINLLEAGNQPGELVVLGPRQADRPRALQFLDAVTNQPGQVLLQDKAYDVFGTLFRDAASRNVIGVSYERAGPHVVWFSEEYRALQKMIDGQFPGMVARLVEGSATGSRFLIGVFSDRQPLIYHQLDIKQHTLGLVKNTMPWIDPKRMQPTSILRYKTRDGRTLDAYLTLPAGATKENPPPLVVLCPGAPGVQIGRAEYRASWGYNPEAQFLASRGFAVLRPNHRGCSGYRWMFPDEERVAFGKMADDVVDATNTIARSGLIDPRRIGTMGTWLGGYLAVAASENEPALFRCAVSTSGTYDWEEWLKERKFNQYSDPEYDYTVRFLGDPRKEPEKYAALSLTRRAGQLRGAVFVAHGTEDTLVPPGQVKRFLSELRRNNVPNESLFVADEHAGINRLENQVEVHDRIVAFLDKNLKNAK